MNHLEVSLLGLFGLPSGRCAPHNHSHISYGQPRMLVFLSESLLLGWMHSFLADEPLQLSLPDKGFNLLLEVVVVSCVKAVITVETAIFISRSLIRISLQLAGKG